MTKQVINFVNSSKYHLFCKVIKIYSLWIVHYVFCGNNANS